MLKFIFIVFCSLPIALLNGPTIAQESGAIPDQIFGVKLGSTFDESTDGELSGLNVARITAWQRFLGSGFHVYFKPTRDYSMFPYEEQEIGEDSLFKTPFRLYVYPVLTDELMNIKSIEAYEAYSGPTQYEVSLIEWARVEERTEESYFWAMDLCSVFEADLGIAPETTDFFEENWYGCVFENEDRKLNVSNFVGPMIRLKYPDTKDDQINGDVENYFLRLRAREISPFD